MTEPTPPACDCGCPAADHGPVAAPGRCTQCARCTGYRVSPAMPADFRSRVTAHHNPRED